MDLGHLEDAEAAHLREYLRFLLWHYRVVDSFWFIKVAEKFGQDQAEQMNEEVWAKVAPMAAKDLVMRFGIHEKGLEGFFKAMRLYPWHLLIGYDFEQSGNEATVRVPNCPTQQARISRGLDEYSCKGMHQAEFEGFAQAIDKRIEVECAFAPPDPHPDGEFCKWLFKVRETAVPEGAAEPDKVSS